MCLIPREAATKKLRADLERSPTKSIVCWKIVCKDEVENSLRGYWRYEFRYNAGDVVSDRQFKHNNGADDRQPARFDKGIHVYTDLGEAKKLGYHLDDRLIAVECHLDDFVGADTFEAVFMKVHIREADYKRTLNAQRYTGYPYS